MKLNPRRHLCVAVLTTAWIVPWGSSAAAPPAATRVTVTPAYFNPGLGQIETIAFRVATSGTIQVDILDRDRFVIRRLPEQRVRAGAVTVTWDGRDDAGVIVPDEAYAVRMTLVSGKNRRTYDPSRDFHPVMADPKWSYSPFDGIITYTLERPSRMHIQAGQPIENPAGQAFEGLSLRTIVDRLPRPAGSVVEKWNGFDESGTISVPGLPSPILGVFATSLPENPILTVGNRRETFFDYALRTRPKDAVAPRRHDASPANRHHEALNALEDRTPPLDLHSSAKGTVPAGTDLDITASFPLARAPYFLTSEHFLDVFVDQKRVRLMKRPEHPAKVRIPATELPPGEHRIVFNWNSFLGPVAVNAFRLTVVEPARKAGLVRSVADRKGAGR